MAGNLIDLSDKHAALPNYFIVDTNIVVERLLSALAPVSNRSNTLQPLRTAEFFARLDREDKVGLIPPAVYGEFVHLAIRLLYRQWGSQQGLKADWLALYKNHPELLGTFRSNLETLRFLFSHHRLTFVSHEDFDLSDPNATFDRRLIEICLTYHLDTGDAGILFEAERLGVDSIVTMDTDLRRAQVDFDIYTWL